MPESKMNARMEEFLVLSEKDLWTLNEELKRARLNFASEMQANGCSSLDESIRKTNLIGSIINGKKKYERDEYFWSEAYLYCKSIEEENFELAREIRKDLEYFKHCFMEDTDEKKMPIKYDILKNLLKQELL